MADGPAQRLALALRRVQRRLAGLRGYLDLDPRGNRVERRADFDRCPRPVLLLYGLFATRRTMEVLERRLRRDGYCVFSIDLGGLGHAFNTRGINDLAEHLRAKVERMRLRHPGMGPLTIVGHSKGGLIGAYYVKRLGGHLHARALVTLGTPHNGTPVAYAALPVGLLARSILQMTPMSPFIRRLQEGPWPRGVRLTSIYSRRDAVAPYPSALLDAAGHEHVRNVEVDCTHREFLVKRRVYDEILREVRRGDTERTLRAVTGATGR